MALFRDFRSGAARHGAPVTVALVVVLATSFLLSWMSQGRFFGVDFAFFPTTAWERPWTFVSYAFGSIGNFIGVLIACLWLWGIGGMVERELGSRTFAKFWLLMTALGALSYYIGFLILRSPEPLFGPYVPLAATTVVWGTRNPTLEVLFLFVLRVQARWIAWISAGLVFFGTMSPAMGVFAIAPLVLAHFYAANKLPFLAYGRSGPRAQTSKEPVWMTDKYLDEVKKREKEREERERLRKLFENSISDEPKDDR
jgi:membrane associated rhomboid family serine protease